MEDNRKVSVVVATLGGDRLAATLESLNTGTLKPAEILICIPTENIFLVNHLVSENVLLLPTSFRGQVAQRALGFKQAKYDLVMQIDDDLIVDKHCLQTLVETLLNSGSKSAVGPALLDESTGRSVYERPKVNRFWFAFYHRLMNGADGYRPGTIDKSGSSIGLDPDEFAGDRHDVEWLAGGCVLHYRENLILENYWPLPGKAFYEDVVHSCILTSKGIRLIVDSRAHCSLEVFKEKSFEPLMFLTNLTQDYRGRCYFMRRFDRRSFRIYLFYACRVTRYLYRRIFG